MVSGNLDWRVILSRRKGCDPRNKNKCNQRKGQSHFTSIVGEFGQKLQEKNCSVVFWQNVAGDQIQQFKALAGELGTTVTKKLPIWFAAGLLAACRLTPDHHDAIH